MNKHLGVLMEPINRNGMSRNTMQRMNMQRNETYTNTRENMTQEPETTENLVGNEEDSLLNKTTDTPNTPSTQPSIEDTIEPPIERNQDLESRDEFTDQVHAMYKMETQAFEAAFDIIINEVIPEITSAIEAMNRATMQYQNALQTRDDRIELLDKEETLRCNYRLPRCQRLAKRVEKYYSFVTEETNDLNLLLNEADASVKNMVTFKTLWKTYEDQLVKCIHTGA